MPPKVSRPFSDPRSEAAGKLRVICWRDEYKCWGKIRSVPAPERAPRPLSRRERPELGAYEYIGWCLEGRPEDDPPKAKRRRRKVAKIGLHKWSKKVRQRDGECVVCGSKNNLEAHHIKPKCEYPELALDLDNGETRCRPCHRLAHPELPESMFAIAA